MGSTLSYRAEKLAQVLGLATEDLPSSSGSARTLSASEEQQLWTRLTERQRDFEKLGIRPPRSAFAQAAAPKRTKPNYADLLKLTETKLESYAAVHQYAAIRSGQASVHLVFIERDGQQRVALGKLARPLKDGSIAVSLGYGFTLAFARQSYAAGNLYSFTVRPKTDNLFALFNHRGIEMKDIHIFQPSALNK